MPFFAPLLAWIFGAGVLPFVIRTVLRFLCGTLTYWGFKSLVLPALFSTGFVVGLFNGLPDGVYYFLRISMVPEGIAILASCYVAVWIINKISRACSVFV